MDKVKGFIFPSSGDGSVDDGIPWWMKYAGKAAGILGGVVAMVMGVMCALSIFPTCIVAGIWQVTAGALIIGVEAPFCCMFIESIQGYSRMVDSRPPWQKAALYVILAIPPVVLCIGLTTILGSGLIAATGVLYGMQVVGKKASQADMAAAARGTTEPDEKNIMEDGDWQTNP